MRANNPATFVTNGGYHYGEEVEKDLQGPWNGSGGGRKWNFAAILPVASPEQLTAAVGGTPIVGKLPSPFSAPPNARPLARAPQRSLFCSNRKWQPWKREKLRRENERERERVARERERGAGGGPPELTWIWPWKMEVHSSGGREPEGKGDREGEGDLPLSPLLIGHGGQSY